MNINKLLSPIKVNEYQKLIFYQTQKLSHIKKRKILIYKKYEIQIMIQKEKPKIKKEKRVKLSVIKCQSREREHVTIRQREKEIKGNFEILKFKFLIINLFFKMSVERNLMGSNSYSLQLISKAGSRILGVSCEIFL